MSSLITTDDALAAIRATANPSAQILAELPLFIESASAVIEDLCGPLAVASRTLVTDGGRTAVALPARDIGVTSVTVDGVVLAADAYDVDAVAGILYSSALAAGRQNVSVVYTVGSAVLPENLRLACMEQLRFLWQTTRSGTGRAAQDVGYTPAGYAVPFMVQGLCATHMRAPGFA